MDDAPKLEINAGELDSESEQRIRDLGHISITPEAKALMDESNLELTGLFERYVKGDYGELVPFEARWQNDIQMYQRRGQVKAIYNTPSGRRLSITTVWCTPVTMLEEVE